LNISIVSELPSGDLDLPQVDLISPANNTFNSDANATIFVYSVNDITSGIAYCDLLLNAIVNKTNTTVVEGVHQRFSEKLARGSYVWQVNCKDDSAQQNLGVSQARKIRTYKCGDANDDGKWNLQDIIYLVNYIFKGGASPVPTLLAGDANGDGKVNLQDIIYLVNYVFKGGPKPCA